MTHDQIIREEFEAWYAPIYGAHRKITWVEDRNQYHPREAQDAWTAWQAAWAVAEGYSA